MYVRTSPSVRALAQPSVFGRGCADPRPQLGAAVGESPAWRLDQGLPASDAAWRELAAMSRNIFLTPEWVRTWTTHFADERNVVTARAERRGGTCEALAFMHLSRRKPLRVLRFLGHGPADELGVACAPQQRFPLTQGLADMLRASAPADVLVCDQSPGEARAAVALAGETLLTVSSPRIDFSEDATWDVFLASRTRHFRGRMRRVERDFHATGSLAMRETTIDRLDADLETFFRLHRERFGSTTQFLANGRAASFHRTFARLAAEQGWLRLRFLEHDGIPVAAWYGFRYGGYDWHYQNGRAKTAPPSSGTILLLLAVRSALEAGSSEYRFLRGGHAYKERWATNDDGLATVAAPLTRKGRLPVRLAHATPNRHSMSRRLIRRTLLFQGLGRSS